MDKKLNFLFRTFNFSASNRASLASRLHHENNLIYKLINFQHLFTTAALSFHARKLKYNKMKISLTFNNIFFFMKTSLETNTRLGAFAIQNGERDLKTSLIRTSKLKY